MQNFLISFRVVFPIFLLMVLGFFIKKIKLVNDTTVKQVNNLIFRVFLPTMIFKNVYDSEISEVFNVKLIAFAVLCVLGCIALLFLTVPLLEKDNSRRGVMIQGIFRSNFVIFGLPITQALCGGSVSGAASVLIAVIIPIFNFFAVISLEVFQSNKPNFLKVLKGIVTNPLIIASVLGLLINFCGIRFSSVFESAMGSVSSVTTPLALIILGASI
jgi:predicted permease